MATGVSISFGLVDVTAKQDTTAVCKDRKAFIDPQDLALEGVYAPKIATLERNYFRLDGSFRLFPENPEDVTWGIWSESMTDDAGRFAAPPVLTLTFQELHASMGLTFEFDPYDNNYCNELRICWYHGVEVLAEKTFQPDSWRYSCMETVQNYDKIEIVFYGTVRPHRYLKVQNIMHGVNKQFGKNTLKSAALLEEIDLSGLTVSSNTLEFTVYSEDDDFNIFNPKGIYTLLQKKQQLTVEGEADGTAKHLGTFYLEDMEMEGDKLLSVSAQDGIGSMDGTTYRGGMYREKPAHALLKEIMDDAGFGYTLDSTLRNVAVTGYLPICSHREALQHLAFAIGGYVSTARSGTVNIMAFPDFSNIPTVSIGRDRKFVGTKVKLRSLVTGVNVKAHEYSLSDTVEELCKVTLTEGRNEILFSEPAAELSVVGGTLAESGVNYCIVEGEADAVCTVSGRKYVDTEKTVTVRMAELPAGDKENNIDADSTLLNSTNAEKAAQRLFAYYQYRIEQDISFVMQEEQVGLLADIETEYGVYRGSVLESMDTDLTGGFVTKAVTIGE